jgi:EAL domain-containing protein (putative c-di-GMP-specific phosphodiesterase class I)
MRDAATAVGTLRALKAQGVEIAMDDFGTGFSSLSYLKRLPIDILKIDRSFVRDLPDDEEDAAIVRMIAALAQSLGLTLHAEGIETQAQRHFLLAQGCHAPRASTFHPRLPARKCRLSSSRMAVSRQRKRWPSSSTRGNRACEAARGLVITRPEAAARMLESPLLPRP